MCSARTVGLALALLLLTALDLRAQLPTIAPGVTVRLKAATVEACERTACKGELVALTTDDYVVRFAETGDTLAIPRAEITSMEIKVGEHNHALAGGIIGATAGIIGGLGYLYHNCFCIDGPCYNCPDYSGFVALSSVIVFMAVGRAIGAARVTEDFERVPPAYYRLDVGYSGDGPAVCLSIIF